MVANTELDNVIYPVAADSFRDPAWILNPVLGDGALFNAGGEAFTMVLYIETDRRVKRLLPLFIVLFLRAVFKAVSSTPFSSQAGQSEWHCHRDRRFAFLSSPKVVWSVRI